MTISSWLNFGRHAPPGRGSTAGENFWPRLTTAIAQCLRLSERFFSLNSSSHSLLALRTSSMPVVSLFPASSTFSACVNRNAFSALSLNCCSQFYEVITALMLVRTQWLKWFCEAGGGLT